MPSNSKIKTIQLIGRVILVQLVVLVLVLGWILQTGTYNLEIIYGIGGLLALLFLLLFIIQHKVSIWLALLVDQVSFASSSEFDSLYERSPVAYVTIEMSGKVVAFNPAAVNLLQATADTFNQVNFYQRILPSKETNKEVLQEKITAGITVNDKEVLLQSAAGSEVWVMMSVHAHRDKNQRLISLIDVTEQKSIDTAKSEFVALATHQLRTPIAAIRWNVELLRKNMKETITEDQVRYLTKVERNVIRMINLINDFLNVSKLEMGTFATNIETVNVPEFFDSILDEFAEKIKEKKLQLNRNDEPPQLQIKTDSRLFHIIISNLLSNSVKYMLSSGSLTLTYQMLGDKLQIVIADTGIGIPEVELAKLFTKFFRASNAQSHQTEGTGLGLYVVRQSVEKLNGTVSVESKEDEGTKFTVILPVEVVEAIEMG